MDDSHIVCPLKWATTEPLLPPPLIQLLASRTTASMDTGVGVLGGFVSWYAHAGRFAVKVTTPAGCWFSVLATWRTIGIPGYAVRGR